MNIVREKDGMKDMDSGYRLVFTPPWNVSALGLATFEIPRAGRSTEMLVSARDVDEYVEGYVPLSQRKIKSGTQVFEVGAGLGGAVEWIVQRNGKDIPPVVVADPFDYRTASEILSYALADGRVASPPLRDRLGVLKDRCRVMLSPMVRHYQMTIGEAVKNHRELHKSADFLIDHLALGLYDNDVYETDILHQIVLKPDGIPFVRRR